jgi:hypothetical protein
MARKVTDCFELHRQRRYAAALAEPGLRSCACRDCFGVVIGPSGTLCPECRSAGCEPWIVGARSAARFDCQAVDDGCEGVEG